MKRPKTRLPRYRDIKKIEFESPRQYRINRRNELFMIGWYCDCKMCCRMPWKNSFQKNWKKHRKTQYYRKNRR